MPIRSFTFAFKLDAKDLLAYVVERNMAVDIHATGTKRTEPEALPAPTGALALPPPKLSRSTQRAFILAYFIDHPKESVSTTTVKTLLEGAGFNYSHNTMHNLLNAGLVKRTKPGTYRVTAKALRREEA